MAENHNQQRVYDAVISYQAKAPDDGLVLGGLFGVKRHLASGFEEQRIAALSDALKYGEAGLDLVIQALLDESEQVQLAASKLLQERTEPIVEPALRKYNTRRAHKLLERYAAGQRNFERADLSLADLSEVKLSGANLNWAILSWTDLSGSDLSEATLSEASLSWTDLSGADLSGANLSWANLSWANLSGANLSGAALNGVDMRALNLSEATLNGVDLTGVDLSLVNLREADLRGATLSEASLSEADLRGAILRGADLSGANLCGADLSEADLSGAIYDLRTKFPRGFNPVLGVVKPTSRTLKWHAGYF